MVGAVRFELTTSCTRNKRATRLRYAPNQSSERCRVPATFAMGFFEVIGGSGIACLKFLGLYHARVLTERLCHLSSAGRCQGYERGSADLSGPQEIARLNFAL